MAAECDQFSLLSLLGLVLEDELGLEVSCFGLSDSAAVAGTGRCGR